jgi:hypothetical protein
MANNPYYFPGQLHAPPGGPGGWQQPPNVWPSASAAPPHPRVQQGRGNERLGRGGSNSSSRAGSQVSTPTNENIIGVLDEMRSEILNRLQQESSDRRTENLAINSRLSILENNNTNQNMNLNSNPPFVTPVPRVRSNFGESQRSPASNARDDVDHSMRAPLALPYDETILRTLPRTVRGHLNDIPITRPNRVTHLEPVLEETPAARSIIHLKKEDYPTFDGCVESNHVLFIKHVTQLRDLNNIPDSEILSMLPLILKGTAKGWWEHEVNLGHTTWNQWALALSVRFSKQSWFRGINKKLQESTFSPEHYDDVTGWATQYIQLLESYHPDLTLNGIRHRFANAIPPEIAQGLEQALLLATAIGKPISITQYISMFEDQASYYIQQREQIRARAHHSSTNNSSRPSSSGQVQRTNQSNRPPYQSNRPPYRSNQPNRYNNQQRPMDNQSSPRRPAPQAQDNSSTRVQPATSNTRFTSLQPGNMNTVRCHNCHQTGHYARDCRNPAVQAIDADDNPDSPTNDELPQEDSHHENNDSQEIPYESNNWDDWVEDEPPLESIVLDDAFVHNFWNEPHEWFDWSEDSESNDIPQLQAMDISSSQSATVPISEFLSSADTSLDSYRLFLQRYGLGPEDSGPNVLHLPNGICFPTPASRPVLKDFLASASNSVSLEPYPALVSLSHRRNNYHWLWLHAREFGLLNIVLSHDTAAISHDSSLTSSIDHPSAQPTIIHASLVQKGRAIPRIAAPPVIYVSINGRREYITLDTGAAISVINETTFCRHFPNVKLHPSPIPSLKAFGHRISPVGTATVSFVLDHPIAPVQLSVPFLVLRTATCPTPILLGMNVIRGYGIDILYSSSVPCVRIGSLPHSFSLVRRPDVTPRLDAVITASPIPDRGQPSTELSAFTEALAKCSINKDLSSVQHAQLVEALSAFPMAFAHGSNQLGRCFDDEMVMDVNVPSPTPPSLRKPAYPISPKSRVDMDTALDDLISWDIIRPSRSQFASPAIMTYLKGKPRMCVDYRVLNTYTVPITYPMPRITESLPFTWC